MTSAKSTHRTIAVVLNPGAGSADAGSLEATIRQSLADHCRLAIFSVAAGEDVQATLDRACDWLGPAADGESDRVLAGAGGDGTTNAVAQRAWERQLAFAPLPAGTFNLVARGEGFGESLDTALPALLRGAIIERAVPLVNDRLFLANAGIGMYPTALEEREDIKRALGRNRVVAIIAGLKTMIGRFRLYRLVLQTDELQERAVVTPALLICANPVQLERLGLNTDPGLGRTHLVALSASVSGVLDMLGLAWRALTGTLGESPRVHDIRFTSMHVKPAVRRWRRWGKVSIDGEVCRCASPLHIRLSERPLRMVMPLVVVDDPATTEVASQGGGAVAAATPIPPSEP